MKHSYNGPRLVSDRSGSDDETVAKLLRLAGHRPDVPAQDAKIVKEAARVEWLKAVKAQRRRSFYLRGGGLLAAAALVLLVLNTDLLQLGRPSSGQPVATVAMATGAVRASIGEGSPAGLALGATLLPGSTVETAALGAGSEPARVAFRLADGTSIRLDVGSRLRFLSDRVLALDRGALYADSGPNAATSGRSLEIRTPLGVARDIGTQFIVRLDDPASNLEVQVREGKVALDRDGDASQMVDAGFELAVQQDGSVTLAPLPPFGAAWDWTLAVRPPFDANGKSLHEILTWAARENGWQLSYADPAFAAQAAAVVVHGSTDGMTPEDIVATFLLGSGELSYRLDAGVLLIESTGS